MPSPKENRLITWAGAIIVAIIALLLGYPTTASGCFIFKQTDLYCPGCGGTRAAHHLTAGQWLHALRDNALIYPVALLFIAHITRIILRPLGKKASWKTLKITKTRSFLLLTLVITFTIWRNLPNGAFLRPTELNPPKFSPSPPSAY